MVDFPTAPRVLGSVVIIDPDGVTQLQIGAGGTLPVADIDSSAGLEQIHDDLTGTLTMTADPFELAGGETHIGQVGGAIVNPTSATTLPTGTPTYSIGDLVANSATAGSVTPFSWTVGRIAAGSLLIPEVAIRKSGTGVTAAQFRLHLYRAAPTIANGDDGVFSTSGVADYLGAFDVTVDRAFTDGAYGAGSPITGSYKPIKLASGTTIVGLLEARAAYTRAASEIFTVELKVLQD